MQEQADQPRAPRSTLQALQDAIEALPAEQREELAAIASKLQHETLKRQRIMRVVQEALGQLRVDMKYLFFDLDATRRERDAHAARLRQLGAIDEEEA